MSPEIEAKLYELLKRVPYTSHEHPDYEFFYTNVADIPSHLDPVFGKVDISLQIVATLITFSCFAI